MFNLVSEKYFDMNKKHAREALDIYKRFLIRMDRVGEFLKTAEKFGIDKQDIPDLARVRINIISLMHISTCHSLLSLP